MAMPRVSVVIPFRDRGNDPNRSANLRRVTSHWSTCPYLEEWGGGLHVQGDGRGGDELFNRSAAYNLAIKSLDSDVYVFTESDIIIDFDQIKDGISAGLDHPGLVVPFTRLLDLDADATDKVRRWECCPQNLPSRLRRSYPTVGAVNIVSRTTMAAVGQWDERFESAWSDDNAMERAFSICCGPTRFMAGDAYHLFHHHPQMAYPHPGSGHLSESNIAMELNRRRWFDKYRYADTPERIRELTAGGD